MIWVISLSSWTVSVFRLSACWTILWLKHSFFILSVTFLYECGFWSSCCRSTVISSQNSSDSVFHNVQYSCWFSIQSWAKINSSVFERLTRDLETDSAAEWEFRAAYWMKKAWDEEEASDREALKGEALKGETLKGEALKREALKREASEREALKGGETDKAVMREAVRAWGAEAVTSSSEQFILINKIRSFTSELTCVRVFNLTNNLTTSR